MIKIAVFGGTTEGRQAALFLAKQGYAVDLFAATNYAKEFMPPTEGIHLSCKRLLPQEMQALFAQKQYTSVVDATHPFAVEVTCNIRKATQQAGLEYLRIVRPTLPQEGCRYVNNLAQCVTLLNAAEGNILLTTGSKNLDTFTQVEGYAQRVYPRVLPMMESLERCLALGYANKNIICMQGPFSVELNAAMLRQIAATVLVTKESAHSGGLEEKVEAARQTGAQVIILAQQAEQGYSLEEFEAFWNKQKTPGRLQEEAIACKKK